MDYILDISILTVLCNFVVWTVKVFMLNMILSLVEHCYLSSNFPSYSFCYTSSDCCSVFSVAAMG